MHLQLIILLFLYMFPIKMVFVFYYFLYEKQLFSLVLLLSICMHNHKKREILISILSLILYNVFLKMFLNNWIDNSGGLVWPSDPRLPPFRSLSRITFEQIQLISNKDIWKKSLLIILFQCNSYKYMLLYVCVCVCVCLNLKIYIKIISERRLL